MYLFGCFGGAGRDEPSLDAELHAPGPGLVGAEIRLVAVKGVAKIRDDHPSIHCRASTGRLEHAGSGFRIKTGLRDIVRKSHVTVLFVLVGKAGGGEIMVKVVIRMAGADRDAAAVLSADVKDVIPAGAVLNDPAVASQSARPVVVFLENGVVEDIHVARHPLFAVRVAHLEKRAVGHVPLAARGAVRAAGYVTPDVERSDRDGCVRDGYEDVFDIIVPNSHVLIPSLGLDTVVPAVGDIVAVDVAIRAWKSPEAAVVAGAHSVVEVMIFIRPALVVPDDVVAGGLPEDHRLWPLRVVGIPVFLRPAVGVPRGMVDAATLDDDGMEVSVVAVDAGLVIFAPAVFAFAAPLADIAVFDDDVMAGEDPDAVFLHVPYRKAAEDDVISADGNTEIFVITGVDGGAGAVVQHISARFPRSVYGQGGVPIRHLDGGLHGKFLAPSRPPALNPPLGPRKRQGDIVGRARDQVYQAAAVVGLAFGGVEGPITHGKALTPRLSTVGAVINPHFVLGTPPRRRPVNADTVERRNHGDPAIPRAGRLFGEAGQGEGGDHDENRSE